MVYGVRSALAQATPDFGDTSLLLEAAHTAGHNVVQAATPGPAPVPTGKQVGMVSQMDQSHVDLPSQDAVVDVPIVRGAPLPHGEGARRMGERLHRIFDANDWRADPAKPFERIPYY